MQRTDWWLLEVEGGGVSKRGEGGQKAHISNYKINKSWDVIYIMAATVNNTMLHI